MIKRSELLLLLDDRTNETGLELPAVSHFLAMYGLCSYSGLYIKILLVSAIVRTAGCESIFSKYFLSLTLRECLYLGEKIRQSRNAKNTRKCLYSLENTVKVKPLFAAVLIQITREFAQSTTFRCN